MSIFEKFKMPKEIVSENKILFDKLLQLTISDLKYLKKINSKFVKNINTEIEYKIYDKSLDEIDKIEINKSREKLRIEKILIEEAIVEKYSIIFTGIN